VAAGWGDFCWAFTPWQLLTFALPEPESPAAG
jgi:hypothetical protein